MIIYPAIDLKDGKCVRLSQGKFDDVTVYSNAPHEVAEKFVSSGAKYIHVVDLDGAKDGKRKNAEVIKKIAVAAGDVPVQLGGGIRSMQDIDEAIALGVNRVIIGTAAVEKPDFVKQAVEKYGKKIVVGIDAKDGLAATRGWETVSEVKAVDLAVSMEKIGVKTIIYTDIATDGMLKGPNFDAMREMAAAVSSDVIASGGVSCMDDIHGLNETGVSGVIVGKAIYAGNVDLDELLNL
jgi:phosphoribosylformimino-5-aminoimidazole carboxamide ribotide isomerase